MSENADKPATGPSVGAGPSAAATASRALPKAAEAASEGNPVFRMMGLPRIRARLPSRNWLIFLSITGSWTAAVLYDRQQKKRVLRKWCDLVSPVAEELLPTNTLPRRVTIYLQAPPGDGLRAAREHFYEYVKPVLVAAAMDWDVVEGRREGDVRYGTAERVRKFRRRHGESGTDPEEDEKQAIIEMARERGGTTEFQGIAGDVVIGRHTWKEYIRGLHEGWLGPIDKPEEAAKTEEPIPTNGEAKIHTDGTPSLGDAAVTAAANLAPKTVETQPTTNEPTSDFIPDDASPVNTEIEAPKPAPEPTPEETAKAKKVKPDPYISTAAYSSASLPTSFPDALGPTTVLPFPHILGFFNTPIRIYRFLNQRQLADDVGRRTAAAILASYRSFDAAPSSISTGTVADADADASSSSPSSEQGRLLASEESEWHKSVRKRERTEGVESVWQDRVALDERIAEKMRLFELTAADEERADALAREPRSAAAQEAHGEE